MARVPHFLLIFMGRSGGVAFCLRLKNFRSQILLCTFGWSLKVNWNLFDCKFAAHICIARSSPHLMPIVCAIATAASSKEKAEITMITCREINETYVRIRIKASLQVYSSAFSRIKTLCFWLTSSKDIIARVWDGRKRMLISWGAEVVGFSAAFLILIFPRSLFPLSGQRGSWLSEWVSQTKLPKKKNSSEIVYSTLPSAWGCQKHHFKLWRNLVSLTNLEIISLKLWYFWES